MQRTLVFIVLASCAFTALSLAKDMKNTKPSVTVVPAEPFISTNAPPTTTTTKPTTTTTTKPTTKPTTTHTTTQAPHTNTTTQAPHTNTTTQAPHTNTTTQAPHTNTTTQAPHTNTTTQAPHTNTTTTKATTTTSPSTTPSVTPTQGRYNLTTDKGDLCLLAETMLKIRLASTTANGTFIVQPQRTNVQGGCKETTANLTLVFSEGFITFLFNKSSTQVFVDTVSFKLSYPFMTGGNSVYSASNSSLTLFAARIGYSYSCRNQSVYMGNGLYLDLSEDKMQAFSLKKSDFGSPDYCPADRPDYRVAIGVGVTLLVLIVVVVIAYLLGRRKRTDGYQSL